MEHLIQILGVLGIGTGIAAAIGAYATRKKVGAETEGKVVATAGELVDDLRADVNAARTERNEERRSRIVAEARVRRWWERADAFSPWVRLVTRLMDEAGVKYPPPPPLYPPEGE